MSTRKILTDDGLFYAAFDSRAKHFLTPAFASVEPYAEYAAAKRIFRDCTKDDWRRMSSVIGHVYDVRMERVRPCLVAILRLEAGYTLPLEYAQELYLFAQFLEHALALSQREDPALSEAAISGWIDELDDLRKCYPGHYEPQDILKNANDCSYGEYHGQSPFARISLRCKLAGRYLQTLVNLSNLVGENPTTPVELVGKFCKQY